MLFRKWFNRYSVDCKLKYPCQRTQNVYISQVGKFLMDFKNYEEPKAIPTLDIKEK